MKLTVKLIFTTVLIVALAVSICSYLLLSGSFRSELNMQYEAAMQESTLFSSSMGNMALQTMANSFQDGAQESVERFLEGGVHLKRYAYQVLTGDGTVLSASTRQTPRLSAADAGTTQVMEYTLKLGSNPEFTASVLVAYARAAARLNARGEVGALTVFDVAPGLLSPKSPEQLRAELL